MSRLNLFLTVGSQMPFDRMVAAVALWARSRSLVRVQAQVGHSCLSEAELHPLSAVSTLAPGAYLDHCRSAHLIVAHAGMGSILTAMEWQRPLVVMPRRGHLGETRNDHQFETAQRLIEQGAPGAVAPLHVALHEAELPRVLDRVCRDLGWSGEAGEGELDSDRSMEPPAPALTPPLREPFSSSHGELIRHLREVIESTRSAAGRAP